MASTIIEFLDGKCCDSSPIDQAANLNSSAGTVQYNGTQYQVVLWSCDLSQR